MTAGADSVSIVPVDRVADFWAALNNPHGCGGTVEKVILKLGERKGSCKL